MSEAIAGLPPPPPGKPPRDASAVIVWRRTWRGVEVFWLEREQRLSFAGGFFAFPGGKVDAADDLVPVRGASGDAAKLVATAARELFEETGLLVARGPRLEPDGPRLEQEALDGLRKQVLDGASFAEVLQAHGLELFASDFRPAGRWLTPPYLPVRFDARFFLVEAPEGQVASVWPGELASGEWIRPSDALVRWEAGSALLHPPNLHALSVMNGFTSVDEAVAALSAPPWCEDFISRRLEFQRGVHVVPLETPTLPPATHTNAYVLGTRELLLVDPGAPDEAEARKLVTLVKELEAAGCEAKAVVLTHHHGDHTGGAQLVAAALGLPVWAHAQTAARVQVPVVRLLEDGEVLALDGPLPMRWRVLHTPGHAPGHVCLFDERSHAGVVGDMVSTVSTIIIDPPEGDMKVYLEQLERLRVLPLGALYPAHGPVVAHGVAKLEEYLEHRAWREAKVLEAVRSFALPAGLEQVVPRAYDDVGSFIWPIAERNTVAILQKLVAEHRVLVADGKYRAA
ncbi:MAG: MBL fold metallo-hydrolase [Myxococcaceae bacterium]|nr:MBL fold metallo-hydrolase [Myxococcaceae bacterium]